MTNFWKLLSRIPNIGISSLIGVYAIWGFLIKNQPNGLIFTTMAGWFLLSFYSFVLTAQIRCSAAWELRQNSFKVRFFGQGLFPIGVALMLAIVFSIAFLPMSSWVRQVTAGFLLIALIAFFFQGLVARQMLDRNQQST